MRRVERRYESGLVDSGWTARCPRCDRRVVLATEGLAARWEAAHARYGCTRELQLDESGRGWIPGPEGVVRRSDRPSDPGRRTSGGLIRR